MRTKLTKIIIVASVSLALALNFAACEAASGGSFKDARDGKTYKTVKIGEQTWMAENLNYAINSSVCYDNDLANCEKYGRLYNCETAIKVCPKDWHLPSDAEWDVLTAAVGGKETAGTKLKSTNGWEDYIDYSNIDSVEKKVKPGNGEDKFAFTALPGGRGLEAVSGSRSRSPSFREAGGIGYWWTSTKSRMTDDNNTRAMKNFNAEMDFGDVLTYLSSVRCIKD